MSADRASKEVRKRVSLRLFFAALVPAMALVLGMLGWKHSVGEIPQTAFHIVYAVVVVCALVCVYAVITFYVAHFGGSADAT